MKQTLISFAFGMLLLQGCSKPVEPVDSAVSHASTIAWVKPDGANIDAIFAQAKAANKPVFLYWGAVWCPPCNQVKATVFNRPDFIARSQSVIPVYLDGDTPGAQKLGAQFKVRGYPTMILFRPDRTELTRLPGEVDAQRYMEVLDQAVSSSTSVKESLATALSGDVNKLSAKDWRQLAYYSWDQDEAQLVSAKDKAATLQKLTSICPPELSGPASRLALKTIVAIAQDKLALTDAAQTLTRTQQLLTNTQLSRETFDILLNYSTDIVTALTKTGTPERIALVAQWNTTLDRLGVDPTLTTSDRLGSVYAKVALARIDLAPDAKPQLDASLITQVRAAVNAADKASTTTYERQAIIPNAADLLSEAGLIDESDAMLKAELPKALSPYYHMLVLSSNAKHRGDTADSLQWAEKSWVESKGPATRLQWGVGYISRVIDQSPKDEARILKAASGVLAELEATPETFYERNRRGLEKLGTKLHAWNAKGEHGKVVKDLTAQLDAVCVKLPSGDESQVACSGAFKAKPAKAKA
jgi:thioredoxin-related protein